MLSTMYVHLQRLKGPDDIIYVKRNDMGGFLLTYTDNYSGVQNAFHCSKQTIIRYMEHLFNMLGMDDEPFLFVQVSLNAYPSLLFKIQDLTPQKIHQILNLIYHNFMHMEPSIILNASRETQTYPEQTERTLQ
jgi:hypothetical protein